MCIWAVLLQRTDFAKNILSYLDLQKTNFTNTIYTILCLKIYFSRCGYPIHLFFFVLNPLKPNITLKKVSNISKMGLKKVYCL